MGAAENKEIAIKMYESQQQHDAEGFLGATAENITITVPGHQALLPWRVTVKGRDNIVPWLMDMGKYIAIDKVELKEFVADGDKVVILLHEWLTVVENQFSFELDEVHVLTIHDGKVVDITMYEDTAIVVAALRGKNVTAL